MFSFLTKKIVLLAGAVVLAAVVLFLLLKRQDGTLGGPSNENENGGPGRANSGRFREEARSAGIAFRMNFLPAEQGEKFKVNLYDHGCGVAVADDFDGQGHTAIYFLNQLGPNALYRRNGDGTFTDITKAAGVALGDRVCVGAAWADTRNNGLQDLYVTSTRGGNVFFRNNGDGTFTEVTEKVGLKDVGLKHVRHSQTAVFFDYDNDGFLDLFVTNTAKWTLNDYNKTDHYFPGLPGFWDMAASPHEDNVLYHNNGDGTFTDVTATARLAGKGWGGDVAVFDCNDDGYLDLFVTNMFGASQLYRNNGDGTFTDVAREVLGRTSWGAIGSKVFDFNNDGRLDLLVVDMHSDMWLPSEISPWAAAAEYSLRKKYKHIMGPTVGRDARARQAEERLQAAFKVRYQEVVFGNTLFKKLPSRNYEEVSDRAGVETFWPWGIAIGDFDNNGYEDIFLPSGMGFPYDYWPNALLMNNGNETFTEQALEAGIEPPPDGRSLKEKIGGKQAARSSRCAAVLPGAAHQRDGRLDLVVNNFNDRAFYFRNHFPTKNWAAFKLTGAKRTPASTGSNRDAVGALVRLYVGKEIMVRQVHAAGGYLSQSSQTLHFGLGERSKIDRVEVRWPGTRVWQQIKTPAINSLSQITQTPP